MGVLNFLAVHGDIKYVVFVEEEGSDVGSAVFPSRDPQQIPLDPAKEYYIRIPLPEGGVHEETIQGTVSRNMTDTLIALGFN